LSRSTGLISRRAFSLIELSISTAITGVLLVSLAGVVVVASKALPPNLGTSERMLASAAAMDQMLAELRCAIDVSEAVATAVTFKVPDRDGDSVPETIRYSWAGVGSPLMRTYNGASAQVLSRLEAFSLAFARRKYTTTTQVTKAESSGEVLLSSYNGWGPLVISTPQNLTLSSTSWGAQRFVIDKVSLPANTSRITITKVSLRLRKPSSPASNSYTVAIHLPSAAGASTPAASPVGTPCSLSSAGLSSLTYAWVDATFSDVDFPDASQTALVIVVKGASTSSAVLNYNNALLAPLDNYTLRWYNGSSWQPTSGLDANDAPFFVYGTYEYPVTTNSSVDNFTLATASVSMQPTGELRSRLDGSVKALNEPGIPGP
jgi:prepilin-type N-terminal cleavage/methylation domain-containing protein